MCVYKVDLGNFSVLFSITVKRLPGLEGCPELLQRDQCPSWHISLKVIFIILGFTQVGEFSNISLPGIVFPFTSYNGYLVFSIICYFIESRTVTGAIVGFSVNPLNTKRNQGARVSCEVFLAWLSAGNVSKSCPRAITVALTKPLGHMKKYRLWRILGSCLWRNVVAGLEEESCGDVKCVSFTDGCSYMQCVMNFGVENPVWCFSVLKHLIPAETLQLLAWRLSFQPNGSFHICTERFLTAWNKRDGCHRRKDTFPGEVRGWPTRMSPSPQEAPGHPFRCFHRADAKQPTPLFPQDKSLPSTSGWAWRMRIWIQTIMME